MEEGSCFSEKCKMLLWEVGVALEGFLEALSSFVLKQGEAPAAVIVYLPALSHFTQL